jgi:hypothetical protein
LFLAAPATAAPFHVSAEGGVGLVTGQPGADLRLRGAYEDDVPYLDGSLGLGLRIPVATTSLDRVFPLIGTGSLAGGFRVNLSDRVRVGPVGFLDMAVMPGEERDCGDGDGCRHHNWAGGDAIGTSLAPAVGLGLWTLTSGGGRFDTTIAWQPTAIYDMYVPFLLRLEGRWTAPQGWQIGARATRYQAVATLGWRL